MNPLSVYSSIRSYVESYAGVLGRRFISIIWVIAICAIVWLYGPSLELGGGRPLAPVSRRLIIIGVVFGLWILWMVMGWLKARKAEKAMIDDIAESPEDREAAETKEEIEELRNRLKDAMKLMRKVVGKRMGYAYSFPWYLMIGAPGAGKTTLLVNSGLKFPLGDAMGAEPLQGVGGTRNCNWWFTDRAILIDTAGRYTTQETAAARDKAGWLGFLNMLKRHRPGQPINGVVITISLTDLLTQNPDERLRDIRSIRQRLSELDETLKARIPIYIVLTKTDQLNGFKQFFDGLGKEAREQVWGMTFDIKESASSDNLAEHFSGEFHALQDRLNGLLLERLQQEPDISRRGQIFRFPAQISQLHDSLVEIVEELTSGTDFINRPLMRGVYFASATQEDPARAKPLSQTMNRSYFVSKLFSNVILGEAALVSRDDRLSRRRKILRGAGIGVMATSVVVLLVSWLTGFFFNRDAIATADQNLASYSSAFQLNDIPVRNVTDSDFLRILGPLDTLAKAPEGFELDEGGSIVDRVASLAPGLNKERKIRSGHVSAYDRALSSLLLTRYMVHLQKDLRDEDLPTAQRFDALKYYLGLAGEGPIDRDAILAHARATFESLYPGSGRRTTRENLMTHMAAMLDSKTLPPIETDAYLVAQNREMIAEYSPSQRAFDLLVNLPVAQAIPDWRPQSELGPISARVFARSSGLGLDQGIDGIYTRLGYQSAILPNIISMSEIASNEYWVRGLPRSESRSPSDIGVDVAEIYYTEFQQVWRDFLNDFTTRDVTGLADAADLTFLLSGDARPIDRFAEEVAKATYLTGIGDGLGFDLPEDAPNPIDGIAPNLPFDPLAAPDPYRSLRAALAPTSGDDPSNKLAPLQPAFQDVYDNVNRALSPVQAISDSDQLATSLQELNLVGRGLPVPVDAIVIKVAGDIADLRLARVQQEVSAAWQAQGAEQCEITSTGKYPFVRNARDEITISDFSRIFGNDGLFDSFFDENLVEFVDQTTDPWTWKGGLGTSGETTDALIAFQNADKIRTAFFPANALQPRVVFGADLLFSSEEVNSVQFNIGGDKRIILREGSDIPQTPLLWPPEDGLRRSVLFRLPRSVNPDISTTGEWAPFRLFDRGDITETDRDNFTITFGSNVRMRITVTGVNNPVTLAALTEFTCPNTLLGN
ncbi:type VI secretion system membrane subunit TssM [Parasulfitobacter algicola]|uniref:Type VI secretion system membrane subunit TssM n=1 Tax=Parasulfitobacter algicola TaxID=2614809 RepID=A0ABX2ILI8_9RHOB|nr:type VI secretion system membrane subunit TssM [Sulfitobacter algicola]NSX53727.1 type VI secretion system membrane subunit TssM [Sulfitobacter algicola]